MVKSFLDSVFRMGVTIIVICGGFTACSDAGPESFRSGRAAPGAARSGDAKEQLHQRNRYDWVGLAHNQAIEDFRREMRDPRTGNKGFCKHLEEFLTRPERTPSSRREASAQDRASIAQGAVRTLPMCQQASGQLVSLPKVPAPALKQSSTAVTLYDQILLAVELSDSPLDLAARLHPILDASQSLSSDEQTLIAVTVSVAQSSMEYWGANHEGFAQDAVSRYGTCTSDKVLAGVPFEKALAQCVDAGGDPLPIRGPGRGEPQVRVANSSVLAMCGSGIGPGLRKIGAADAKGAWSGFFSGAILGGRAVEGALLGGGGASIGAALGLAIEQYICVMAK
jgi:hypothetical protein